MKPALKLAPGAAPMRKPSSPVAQLPFNELKELQQLLARLVFSEER